MEESDLAGLSAGRWVLAQAVQMVAFETRIIEIGGE